MILECEYERNRKQREAVQDSRKNGFFSGKAEKERKRGETASLFASPTLVIGRPEKGLYN
jgi:hypothetical protein